MRIGHSRGVQTVIIIRSVSAVPSCGGAYHHCPLSSRSLVSHTESLALLEIIRLFRHVQPELRDLTLDTIVKGYLPEVRKIYRLICDLLRQEQEN